MEMKPIWPWIEKPRQKFILNTILCIMLFMYSFYNIFISGSWPLLIIAGWFGGMTLYTAIENFKIWRNNND